MTKATRLGRNPERGHRLRLPWLCLAAGTSGAAALVYELLWVRRLGEVFGSTVHAVIVVLSVFFLGLGVGAYGLGKVADRLKGSIGLFCSLECVVGMYGLAFLTLSDRCEAWYTALAPAEWPFHTAILFKAVASAMLLLVPALAMGGTLPALTRHVVHRSDQLASRLGWLYGVNTLGAAAGAAAVILLLIPGLGVPAAFRVAAATNGASLLIALAARLRKRSAASPETPLPGKVSRHPAGILMSTAGLSGFVSVGFELLWTRALASRFLGTVYSFTTILVVFLLCLGVGSILVTLLDRYGRLTRSACAMVTIGAGLAGLLSVVLLGIVPSDLAYGSDPEVGFFGRQLHELLWSVLVMTVPLLLFGLNFPLIIRLMHREIRHLGHDVGRVYLSNTVGSVAAPLVVGLLLLPAAGIKPSLIAISWLMVLFGVAVLLPWTGLNRRRLGLAGAAAMGFGMTLTVLPPRDIRLWRHTTQDTLVAYREGVSASIAVVREPDGNLFLKVDNSYRLGDARTRFAQQRQGLIPVLLHPDPQSALFIGMGTGSSAGAAAAYGGLAIDVLEIIPELTGLLPHFDSINLGLRERAEQGLSVRLMALDARHYVRTTPRRYDVVVGDLFVPWRTGEGGMYVREHFEAVREILAEDGLFCQWLPLYQLSGEELRIVTATFCDVFPEVSVWWLYFNAAQPVAGLVGSAEPLAPDPAELESRASRGTRSQLLLETGLRDVRSVLASWIADKPVLCAWAAASPIESRDRPRIEFVAPLGHFRDPGTRSASNVGLMLELRQPITANPAFDILPPERLDGVARYQAAIADYLRGQSASLHLRDERAAMTAYASAFLLAPDVPLTGMALEGSVREGLRDGRLEVAEIGVEALKQVAATAHLGCYHAAEIRLARGDREGAIQELLAGLKRQPQHEESWRFLETLEREAAGGE